jgi:hypothetical protein
MNLRTGIFILILMCIRYFGFGTITLKEINAYVKDDIAIIDWTTSAELNNKKFIIERSSDCVNFCAIGDLAGETNSATDKNYSFADKNAIKGIGYYRIVSVDNSENKTFSQILIVDNRKAALSNSVFPCPFTNELNLLLNSNELPLNSKVVVYGSSGREIYSCVASTEMKLDLSALQKGTYYVTVESNNERLVEKKVLKSEN